MANSKTSANSNRRPANDGKVAWLCALFLYILLSVAGVANHALGFPLWNMPRSVISFLEWFTAPGCTVWWFTTGSLFAGYPSNASGYAITIGANVVAWLLAGALFMTIARFIRRRFSNMITNQQGNKNQ